jgi:hypothetical protein
MQHLLPLLEIMLSAFLFHFAILWLRRAANRKAKRMNEVLWLEYPAALKLYAGFFVVFAGAIFVNCFNLPGENQAGYRIFLLSLVIFAVVFAMEILSVKVGFDASRIYACSCWRADRTVDWDDVESASFSQAMQGWVIQTKHAGKIHVSNYLSGFSELLAELRRRGIASY